MIAVITGAQENRRAETHSYLDASDGNLDAYFPTESPKLGKVEWNTAGCTTNPCRGFQRLNVKPDGPVVYRYSTIAGNGDGTARTIDGITFTTKEPWCIVKARGDTDQNGVDALFWSASFTNQIMTYRADE